MSEKKILKFSVLLIICSAVAYFILPHFTSNQEIDNNSYVGITMKSNGNVKIRYKNSVNWTALKENDGLFSESYIFTGESSQGKFAFLDNSLINLESNSLIQIKSLHINPKDGSEAKPNALKMKLVNGSVQFDLKSNPSVQLIEIEPATIQFNEKETKFHLSKNDEKGMQVSVIEGDININTPKNEYNIKAGSSLEITESEVLREVIPEEIKKKMEQEYQDLTKMSNNRHFTRSLDDIYLIFSDVIKDIKEVFLN